MVALFAGCLHGAHSGGLGNPPLTNSASDFAPEVDPVRLPEPSYDFTKAIVADHGFPGGHSIASLHEGSYGLQLVGHHPLANVTELDSGGPSRWFSGIDTWSHYVCVAQWGGTGGVRILDIQAPNMPRLLSHVHGGLSTTDCQFSDDGQYLFVGDNNGNEAGYPPLPPPMGVILSGGLAVYEVADKSNPKFLANAASENDSNGFHNLFTATINNTIWVFQPYGKHIFRFVPNPPRLEAVAQVPRASHDVWVDRHPVTGDWIMYTGAGRSFTMYNVNDPVYPLPLATWSNDEGLEGWHRQTPMRQVIDGRAIVVVAGENFDGSTQPYAMVDVTDPSNPETLSTWSTPGTPHDPFGDYLFSPHELETWNGYVAIGSYHAGVWVFDVGSRERLLDPVTIGYYLPSESPGTHVPQGHPTGYAPMVWGAYFDDRGYIVAADSRSGLYVLKFDATRTS